MVKIDYNSISRKYDDVRRADLELIKLFLEEAALDEKARVLDFGCGTGNYAGLVKKITGADVYGVEPSEGMREKAEGKENGVKVKKGDHGNIPFEEEFFDFIYLTDVIHHVPDIDMMFKEFRRVLKKGGKVCIETESHEQIENRFYVSYFPSTAEVDKGRYPKIADIKTSAAKSGLSCFKVRTGEDILRVVDAGFLELVEKKGYSMFHLIPETEYKRGLNELKKDLSAGNFKKESSGGTLVWLKNESQIESYNCNSVCPANREGL